MTLCPVSGHNVIRVSGGRSSEHGPDVRGDLGGPVDGDPHCTVAVLGPGTGFGVSALVRDAAGKEMAMPSEGGHACFPPGDPVEDEILRILRRRYDRVSIERLICGPGLLNMHRALAEMMAL